MRGTGNRIRVHHSRGLWWVDTNDGPWGWQNRYICPTWAEAMYRADRLAQP